MAGNEDYETQRNEDWIKTLSWDSPARTLDELQAITGMTADELRGLPSMEAAPAAIRTALGLPARHEP